jgi:uncharacterized membrane protein
MFHARLATPVHAPTHATHGVALMAQSYRLQRSGAEMFLMVILGVQNVIQANRANRAVTFFNNFRIINTIPECESHPHRHLTYLFSKAYVYFPQAWLTIIESMT